jgi:hypothetical protein
MPARGGIDVVIIGERSRLAIAQSLNVPMQTCVSATLQASPAIGEARSGVDARPEVRQNHHLVLATFLQARGLWWPCGDLELVSRWAKPAVHLAVRGWPLCR